MILLWREYPSPFPPICYCCRCIKNILHTTGLLVQTLLEIVYLLDYHLLMEIKSNERYYQILDHWRRTENYLGIIEHYWVLAFS